jgi:hypothetical protein
MDFVKWMIGAGVALPLVLAFLAGHSAQTYRARRLWSRLADQRRDLANQRRELKAGWANLAARWDEFRAEQADTQQKR